MLPNPLLVLLSISFAMSVNALAIAQIQLEPHLTVLPKAWGSTTPDAPRTPAVKAGMFRRDTGASSSADSHDSSPSGPKILTLILPPITILVLVIAIYTLWKSVKERWWPEPACLDRVEIGAMGHVMVELRYNDPMASSSSIRHPEGQEEEKIKNKQSGITKFISYFKTKLCAKKMTEAKKETATSSSSHVELPPYSLRYTPEVTDIPPAYSEPAARVGEAGQS